MEIGLKSNYGYYLVIKADNVNIEEDIEDRVYEKDGEGKIIIKNPKRDIKTEYLEKIVELLEDMIYHREAEFDSSYLIKQLFDKLPSEAIYPLLTQLNEDYNEE